MCLQLRYTALMIILLNLTFDFADSFIAVRIGKFEKVSLL